jgi:DNA-binding transcriptional LysR family regulator
MLPNSADLSFFLEVSNTGTMSRAAERLGVTQPALSQSMKRLEIVFDKQLLLRGKGGVTLTKAGEKLAGGARCRYSGLEFKLVINPVSHPDLVTRELFKDEV